MIGGFVAVNYLFEKSLKRNDGVLKDQ